ncbi:family 1 glycosylhydrolase [Pannonibacter sp. Pt2-lr]
MRSHHRPVHGTGPSQDLISMNFTRADFPGDFLFGASTSSYQIEGSALGGAGRSQWDDLPQRRAMSSAPRTAPAPVSTSCAWTRTWTC